MSDEARARFEAEFSQPPYEFEMDRYNDEESWPGNYRNYHVQCAWDGWQACEASRPVGEFPDDAWKSLFEETATYLTDILRRLSGAPKLAVNLNTRTTRDEILNYLAKFKVAEEPKFHCLLCKDVGHITVVHQSGGFDATNESCPVCRVAPTVGDNWDSYLASLPDDHPVWGHPLMAECMKQAYQAANETDNSVTRNYRATEFDSSADPQDSVGGDTQVSVPH